MGLFDMVGGLINSGIQVGQQSKDRKNSRHMQKQEHIANRHLAALKYDRDIDMWNKQNKYNTPKAQMDRLEAAGLNKNLMYGSGNVGNADPGPQYQEIKERHNAPAPYDLSQMIPAFQDFQVKKAQIDNVEANTANMNAKTVTEGINSGLIQAKLLSENFSLDKNKKMLPYQLQGLQLNNRQTQSSILQKLAQTANTFQDTLNKKATGQNIILDKARFEYNKRQYDKNVNPNDSAPFRKAGKIYDWFEKRWSLDNYKF